MVDTKKEDPMGVIEAVLWCRDHAATVQWHTAMAAVMPARCHVRILVSRFKAIDSWQDTFVAAVLEAKKQHEAWLALLPKEGDVA